MLRFRIDLPVSSNGWLLFLFLFHASFAGAHHCGEPRLVVEVGRSVSYRISADVSESQASRYNLSINSDTNIATASPDNFASFNYGEFTITGLNPGTNTFVFEWFYDPNAAQGFCTVQVVVVPRGSKVQTAANNPQSGHAGDPVSTLFGEFLLAEPADVDLYGPMPLSFRRYYASSLTESGIAPGGLGPNWLHNFDYRLLRSSNHVEVITERGRMVPFDRSNNVWVLQGKVTPTYQLAEEGALLIFGDPILKQAFVFDASGHLVGIEDGKGNQHTLSYAGNDLSAVSDGLGRQLSFSYIGVQQLQFVTAGSRSVRFSYGFNEELTAARDMALNVVNYSYQTTASGFGLTSRRQPLGNSHFTNLFDSLGRLQAQVDAYGNSNRFGYPATGLTTVTNPVNLVEQQVHDTNAQLVTAVDEAGHAIQLGYDAKGNRTSILDREGGVTQMEYHPSGQLSALTNADGSVVRYFYQPRAYRGIVFYDLSRVEHSDGTVENYQRDSAGNLLFLTNQLGGVWSYTYNSRGQVLTIQNPAGGMKAYTYTSNGSLANLTVDGTNSYVFDYDSLGRVQRETAPDGSVRSYAHDNLDRLTAITNELGGVVSYSYNANNNQISKTHPSGLLERHTFDAMDRLTNFSGANGVGLSIRFDALGRASTIVSGQTQTNQLTYDAVGNVTAITDSEGSIWKSAYDAEGVLTNSVSPLNKTNTYLSDAMGRTVQFISPSGKMRRVVYDSAGRPVQVVAPDGLITSQVFSNAQLASITVGAGGLNNVFARDAFGGATEQRDPNGNKWMHEFDSQGRHKAVVDPLNRRTDYSFDARGRVARAVFPGSLGDLHIEYDGLNAITRRQFSDGVDLRYRYDAKGEFTNADGIIWRRDLSGLVTNCNGIGMSRSSQKRIDAITYAPGKVVTYQYNGRDQVVSMTDWLGGTTRFQYDAAGRLISIVRGNGMGTSIQYDDEDRTALIVHTNLGTLLFVRDADGRITRALRDQPLPAPQFSAAIANTFDSANQIIGSAYDALGRLLTASGRSYRWDLASRLAEFSEGGRTNHFTYDGFSYRLSRQTETNVENYVWNYAMGTPSLLIVRDGAQVDQWYYLYTPGGQLLEAINASTGAGFYYHFDESGNTLWLTDGSQQIVGRYLYDPYGEILAENAQVPNPFTFQGKYGVAREANGLYYMHARYYDSRACRFLSRDPLKSTLPKAANPYQYSLNNPLRYLDPLGLQPVDSQDPNVPAGEDAASGRKAARTKGATDAGSTVEDDPQSTPRSTGIVFLTHEEWNTAVRETKQKLRDRVKKAEWGWFDPDVPATFDSPFLRRQKEHFYFRGLVMNGGELNYYFQGMYWKELGVPEGVMIAIIFAYKDHKYHTRPSIADLYAAIHGYEDTANAWTELRDEAQYAGDIISNIPESIGEVASEAGSALKNWVTPYLPTFGE